MALVARRYIIRDGHIHLPAPTKDEAKTTTKKQPKDKSHRIGKDLFTVIRSLCDSDDFCKPFRADETVAKYLLPTLAIIISTIFIGLSGPILTISLCRKRAAYPKFSRRFRAAVICPYHSVSTCIIQQNPPLIAVIRYLPKFQVLQALKALQFW